MPTYQPKPGPSAQPDAKAAALTQHKQVRNAERAKRLELIGKIATARKSRLLCYVTASRPELGTQVGLDVIRVFREHLGKLGKSEQIDLLLITRGGHTLTPLRLMSLLREFAPKVAVLVPYMAHSAGTLICLGADEIVMGAMGELGPVDPSVANQFNLIVDTADIVGTAPRPRPRIPISVEDVASYLNFAKRNAGLDVEGMASAFAALTSQVHPLALGNILRNHNLIRHLARRLLLMHMDKEREGEAVEAVVKKLTEELHSHDYLITRDEGPALGLKVKSPEPTVEEMMWDLFKLYEGYLGMDQSVNIAAFLGTERERYGCFDAAVIESDGMFHAFSYQGMARRKGQADFEFNAEVQNWELCS